MFYFFVFLFALFSLNANPLSLAVTENDPSTLVEGVSVITGDLYSFEEDYVVQGAEPIRLWRSFLSTDGTFKTFDHLIATFLCDSNCFFIKEHNGTLLCYHPDPSNQIHPAIGDTFFGKKKKVLRYNAHDFTQKAKGVSNTSSGKISAQTHLKNQYITFEPSIDEKGRSFTLHASDGTKRRYQNCHNQKRNYEFPWNGTYLAYNYRLVSETLPNGHVIHYNWDGENRIDRIYTTNLAGTKKFAELTIPVFRSSNPPDVLTLTGSDGRSITYRGGSNRINNLFIHTDVISPELPSQNFGWDLKRRWISGSERKLPYLQTFSLPRGRNLQITYSDVEDPGERQQKIDTRLNELREQIKTLEPKAKKKPDKYGAELESLKAQKRKIKKDGIENEGFVEGYKVKVLSSPVGKEGQSIITHKFFYDKTNKNSYVLDTQNHKTAYFWNDDYRLTHIHRYMGENLYNQDTFLWENTQLRCKAVLDERSNPIFARTYLYDVHGNVQQETFYGDLSGNGTPLKMGLNGLPEENGVERFTQQFTYSTDGRNLLLKEEKSNGLSIQYTYRNDCHLPLTKSIYEGNQLKIQTTYAYNEDLILCSESTHDGLSTLVKKITPIEKGPYVGMPQMIEEFDGNDSLLNKTVLHYGIGASILQKDIYDANNQHRFSLYMAYDEKGRLIRETNPIGQEALHRYDELGNRIYSKDFSGRLETFYEYDLSNRLIRKEEKGDDGFNRVYQYEYDTKHNLVAEIDPYGNRTSYIHDPFGKPTEIHLPNGSITKFKYDSAGNPIEKIDATGHLTSTRYNAYGKPTLITHPDGATESFTYTLDGQLLSHTDPSKVTTTYTYDYLNRIVKKTTGPAVESFEYTGHHLTKKIDPEKNITTYKYDDAGRKISEECAGEETTYGYDEFGRLRTTQKIDLLTVTEYDLLGRAIEERNESPTGKLFRKVRYEYDSAGNRVAILEFVDGKEVKEECKYDSLGRLIEKRDPLNFLETHQYDPRIHRNTHTDPNGLETIKTYNAQNQLASIEKKKNGKTLFLEEKFYTPNGQLAHQIDTIFSPDNSQRTVHTRWEYNARNLLQTLIEADGTLDAKITHYTYTPRNELQTVTKPNGVTLNYRYNDLGQLISLTSSDGTVNHQMEYNLLGHLQKSDLLLRKTDPFGRILEEKFSSSLTIQNTYDKRGRRETSIIPAATCSIHFEYDSAHLKKVTRGHLDGSTLYSHTYADHDLSGNVLEEELICNTGHLHSSYDPIGRKTSIQSPHFNQQVLAFDPLGNIQKMKIDSEPIEYTYDDLYQLTSETGPFAHTYAFDSLNNRLRKDTEPYEITPLNQIASHFTYDLNGNPTQHGTTTYIYDALDRLIQIQTPEFSESYTYDSLHRRLTKTINKTTTYFLYDGQNEIGAFDENNAPLELRILGNTPHAEIGAAIAIELNGKVHLPIHDLQGNLALLQPIDAQPTHYRYSAFGEEKISGQTISPWRFSSKRTDHNLVYFGRRYYSTTFGRWLTPDPAGFTDGMNLYAYVHNNPLTHVDEYGLIMMARDFKTAQQMIKAPWETERPWPSISYNSRHIASHLTHGFYDYCLAHLRADRSFSLFSEDRSEQMIRTDKLAIDRFFGTNLATLPPCPFAKLSLPSPQGMFSNANQISSTVNRLFKNATALNPRKLTNITKHTPANFWPPNRGFIGEIKKEYLMPGTLVDRYGNPSGKFVSPYGIPFQARALPPNLRGQPPYKVYEILKPIEVNSGIVSPAFNQMGLGVQYEFPVRIESLLKRKIIREIGGSH